MKKTITLLVFLLSIQIFAQEDAWIFLKDKPSASTFMANPLTMLTQRALDRRTKQSIALDEKDVPVEVTYYNQIKSASGITALAKSRWLNAIHVQGAKADIDNLLTNFSFVEKIEFANRALSARGTVAKKSQRKKHQHQNKFENSATTFNYGNAKNQIEMLKGETLHQKGFTGNNMHIAVIDAGFPNVNTLEAFKRLRDNNQILGGYDFVNRNDNFYGAHNHGTNVLSDIGAYLDGDFIGTAPDASFYLFRTEDAAREVPLEESLWVEAAERADSLGVDIINSSLGYTTFDNSNYSYTYDDMDGKTTFITRGAEIGVSRGMIIVNSAGNSGSSAWRYMGAPSDAPSVFSIGAVNASGTIASFSSFGPTSDGRVKPDVLAHGQNVYVIDHISGNARTSNGTSFSSPVMAGVIACFWQAFPDLTNMEIIQKIRESADRYTNPTDQHGYGIPNFDKAYSETLSVNDVADFGGFKVFPNPVKNTFTLQLNNTDSSESLDVVIYSVLGKELLNIKNATSKEIDITSFNSGLYLVKTSKGNQHKIVKLIKE